MRVLHERENSAAVFHSRSQRLALVFISATCQLHKRVSFHTAIVVRKSGASGFALVPMLDSDQVTDE